MPTLRICPQISSEPAFGAYSKLAATVAGPTDYLLCFGNHNRQPDPNFLDIVLLGVDANSNPIQLAEAVSLVIASSNLNVVQPLPPNLDQFRVSIESPGTSTVTITVTYKNGLAGPNTITLAFSVIGKLGGELIPVFTVTSIV